MLGRPGSAEVGESAAGEGDGPGEGDGLGEGGGGGGSGTLAVAGVDATELSSGSSPWTVAVFVAVPAASWAAVG